MEYRFADCLLDDDRHLFMRGGEARHLEPQVFSLLVLLARNSGQVVSKAEIIDQVWHGQIVSEATISARISAARQAVGDTGKAQQIIRTIHRVGLQLVAEVERQGRAQSAPMPPVQVRLLQSSDGTGIAWSEIGEGAPLLRAGHWMTHQELDLDNPIWGPWLQGLGRGRRLVRYDPRGTGMSDRGCTELSLELMVDDLKAVADAAGLARFPIFAASQSVSVACAFAHRYPERVSKLILYGSFVQGAVIRDGDQGKALTQAIGHWISTGWGSPTVGALKSFTSLFMPDATEEQVQSFMQIQVASASREWAVRLRDFFGTVDVSHLLPEIEVPVLVAHAANDALQPFSQAQLAAQLLPNASLLRLDSINHILVPQEPAFEQFMTAVDHFLA
ncbi:alpha/beta hydrolase [Tropicibacter sp. R15_0]|uniref:alpha/beta fold hydrolase n=1 Tax=Tropicibacter sp. R15_0 TaxID=2821101 RepID=UPI001ADB6DD8|nr:alpha/beta fold hydrolase [Tropicibacter sp. R15_0]MBO9464959.1 alpha/beta hydrolase [Tropicibacter sp. R15_0]